MIGMYVFHYLFLLLTFYDSADNFILSPTDRAEIVKSVRMQTGTGCAFYVELWDQRLRGESRESKKHGRIPEPQMSSGTLHCVALVRADVSGENITYNFGIPQGDRTPQLQNRLGKCGMKFLELAVFGR
jgi:hypothetical protein